jgi:hypothetical protein
VWWHGAIVAPTRCPSGQVLDTLAGPCERPTLEVASSSGPVGVGHGGAGPQGVTPTPGYLTVGTTPAAPAAATGPATLLSAHVGDGPVARLDAVLDQPEVEWLILGGGGGGQALLRSFARSPRTQAITLEGTGPGHGPTTSVAGSSPRQPARWAPSQPRSRRAVHPVTR